jgi:hypothetical protein
MDCHRELYDTKVRSQVAATPRNFFDEELPDLICESDQLIAI